MRAEKREMKSEEDILRRLKRRMRGTRATVMLEFAVIAPFAMAMLVFAADITRIMRTEQQLEIATRLAADVEAHTADYYVKDRKSPGSPAKNIAKGYLVNIAHVATGTDRVYMKGECISISNPLTYAVTWFAGFLNGESVPGVGDNLFLKMVGKIFGKVIDFITFGTFNYLTDVVPHDREVKVTTAAYIPTVMPASMYTFLAMPSHVSSEIGLGQFAYDLEGNSVATAWNLTVNPGKRHRVYCYMPVIDAVPIAPKTYVRVFKSWCAKQPFLKGLVE